MKILILILAMLGIASAELYTHKLPPANAYTKEFCYTDNYSRKFCADISLWKEGSSYYTRVAPKDGVTYRVGYAWESMALYQAGYFSKEISFYQATDSYSIYYEIFEPATYWLKVSDENLDLTYSFRYYHENNTSHYIEVNPTKQYETATLTPTKSYIDALPSGWNLVGTAGAINENSAFSSAKIVYAYKNGAWQQYDPAGTNIQMQAFQGFWLLK